GLCKDPRQPHAIGQRFSRLGKFHPEAIRIQEERSTPNQGLPTWLKATERSACGTTLFWQKHEAQQVKGICAVVLREFLDRLVSPRLDSVLLQLLQESVRVRALDLG